METATGYAVGGQDYPIGVDPQHQGHREVQPRCEHGATTTSLSDNPNRRAANPMQTRVGVMIVHGYSDEPAAISEDACKLT